MISGWSCQLLHSASVRSPLLAENLATDLRRWHTSSRFGLAVCDLASVWCICRVTPRWGQPCVSPQQALHQRRVLSQEGQLPASCRGAAQRSSSLRHGAKPWAAAFLLGTKCLLELPVLDDGHLFARLKMLQWGGNSCWWLFGEALQWELLMESIPAIAGCPA